MKTADWPKVIEVLRTQAMPTHDKNYHHFLAAINLCHGMAEGKLVERQEAMDPHMSTLAEWHKVCGDCSRLKATLTENTRLRETIEVLNRKLQERSMPTTEPLALAVKTDPVEQAHCEKVAQELVGVCRCPNSGRCWSSCGEKEVIPKQQRAAIIERERAVARQDLVRLSTALTATEARFEQLVVAAVAVEDAFLNGEGSVVGSIERLCEAIAEARKCPECGASNGTLARVNYLCWGCSNG